MKLYREMLRVNLARILTKNKFKNSTNLMKISWDNLIILDACRHDIFEKVCGKTIPFIYSTGSSTHEWIKNTFENKFYYDVYYISANPHISEWGLKKLFGKVIFGYIDNVWEWGWNTELGTVHPKEVVNAVKNKKFINHSGRKIVHFLQPHHPFINGYTPRFKPKTADDIFLDEDTIFDLLRRGKISAKDALIGYEKNLEFVLDYVKKILPLFKGRTIITSDHGDLFGEYGLYGHYVGVRAEGLVKVPFVVINKEK